VIDLIGRPYRLGADGTGADGAIDCIHLVYVVLERMNIPTPEFRDDWYNQSVRQYGRDLLKWGSRIDQPGYDGDVLLLDQAVAWCPIDGVSNSHCFRMKSG
jgi:hypothetical protein